MRQIYQIEIDKDGSEFVLVSSHPVLLSGRVYNIQSFPAHLSGHGMRIDDITGKTTRIAVGLDASVGDEIDDVAVAGASDEYRGRYRIVSLSGVCVFDDRGVMTKCLVADCAVIHRHAAIML